MIQKLPDSELEIMMIIWEANGQISTSDIMRRVKGRKSVQLVQNYLNRLEKKEFIACEKIGHLNHYTQIIRLKDYRLQQAASFIEKLYQNSPTKLFATLLEGDGLTQEDVEEIKRLLQKEDEK